MRAVSMARDIARLFPIDSKLEAVLASVKRELFMPASMREHAYTLAPMSMDCGQWISSPLSVAKMTHYLSLEGADSVLEIGFGSGYQAVILSKLVRRVFSIERIEKLFLESRERLRSLGIHNIAIKLDDGQSGWSQFAPFDRILFSASIKAIPKEIFSQLRVGGILVAPVDFSHGDKMNLDSKSQYKNQAIVRFVKSASGVSGTILEPCDFVPVVDGVQY